MIFWELFLQYHLFANDTKLFWPITDHDNYQQSQNDILTLERWSKLWQLNFNTKK